MIDKNYVGQVVEEWLKDKDYFLVEVNVSPDDRIVVTIDHKEGVWMEDCVELSRYIESRLDRDKQDFELEVGSAGLGQPFKVKQQYEAHVGSPVEVMTQDGQKLKGLLTAADEQEFAIEVEMKVKEPGEKRPHIAQVEKRWKYEEVKYTKYRFID